MFICVFVRSISKTIFNWNGLLNCQSTNVHIFTNCRHWRHRIVFLVRSFFFFGCWLVCFCFVLFLCQFIFYFILFIICSTVDGNVLMYLSIWYCEHRSTMVMVQFFDQMVIYHRNKSQIKNKNRMHHNANGNGLKHPRVCTYNTHRHSYWPSVHK